MGGTAYYLVTLYQESLVPTRWLLENGLSLAERVDFITEASSKSDIPLPELKKFDLKAKFINPIYGETTESVSLGYTGELTIEKLDRKNIPDSYLANSPPAEVSYEVELQIYLLDKDGIQLRALKPVRHIVSSGKTNLLRDVPTDLIPVTIAKRTMSIDFKIYVKNCTNCRK